MIDNAWLRSSSLKLISTHDIIKIVWKFSAAGCLESIGQYNLHSISAHFSKISFSEIDWPSVWLNNSVCYVAINLQLCRVNWKLCMYFSDNKI